MLSSALWGDSDGREVGIGQKRKEIHEHHYNYSTHALPSFSSTQLWPATVAMFVYCTSNYV
jgi:hypothetical protein